MNKKTLIAVVIALGLGFALASIIPMLRQDQNAGRTVIIPALSGTTQAGQVAFNANCAQCHGTDLTGTKTGPPLLHPFYVPNHHGDGAFFLAARHGVTAHHWRFGDMPAQPQVSDQDIAAIVAYVRQVQRANSLF